MDWRARVRHWLGGPRSIALITLVAIVVALPTLGIGMMLDDYTHRFLLDPPIAIPGGARAPWDLFRFQGADEASRIGTMNLGLEPWWTSPSFQARFFRPISSLSNAFDYRVLIAHPRWMHAESIALYAALVAVAAKLFRRIVEPAWVAGLAGLMFAIDPAHATVVSWLANRNALFAGLFGLGAVLTHMHARTTGSRSAKLAGPVLLALALASGETAVAATAYLLAYELWLADGPRRERAVALVPFVAVGLVWSAIYLALGCGVRGGSFYLDPLHEPFRYAVAVIERAPALVLGQIALPPADVWPAIPERAFPIASLIAWAFVLAIGAVAWRLVGHDRRARFFATGMALSLLPPCATWPSDRLLVFVGFGGLGLVALVLEQIWEHAGRPSRGQAALGWLFVVVHLATAPILLPLHALAFAAIVHDGVLRAARALPLDSALDSAPSPPSIGTARDATLIVLNAPDPLTPGFCWMSRVMDGSGTTPHAVRLLTVAISGTLRVTRVDAQTLTLELSDGSMRDLLSLLTRNSRDPLRAGDKVHVEGMSVHIDAADDDRGPTQITYRFDRSLDDPHMRWVVWEGATFHAYKPPSIGATETRAAIDLRRIITGG